MSSFPDRHLHSHHQPSSSPPSLHHRLDDAPLTHDLGYRHHVTVMVTTTTTTISRFGLAESMGEGFALARATLESGKGLGKLDEWIATTVELTAA